MVKNIYINGYCSNLKRNNIGACSSVILDDKLKILETIVSKHYNTSINRLHVQAAIRALEYFEYPCKIVIYSDLEYVVNMTNFWIKAWKKSNWEKKNGKEILNLDLVRKLSDSIGFHTSVKASWIKSDANDFIMSAKHLAEFAATPDDLDMKLGIFSEYVS